MKNKMMINVNYKNQCRLSNESWELAWEHPEQMRALSAIMNVKIIELKPLQTKLKELRSKKPNDQYDLVGVPTFIEQQIEDIETEIEKQKNIKEAVVESKKSFWDLAKQYKVEQRKKHPELYETRWVDA